MLFLNIVMSTSTLSILSIAVVFLLSATGIFETPEDQVTSLEASLGPKVIAGPL
jgi:hypothetical protein